MLHTLVSAIATIFVLISFGVALSIFAIGLDFFVWIFTLRIKPVITDRKQEVHKTLISKVYILEREKYKHTVFTDVGYKYAVEVFINNQVHWIETNKEFNLKDSVTVLIKHEHIRYRHCLVSYLYCKYMKLKSVRRETYVELI
jgi:hypothetical protein